MNGENVILGQIYFVFSFLFNPTARNIEDERVKKKSARSNTVRRGVEEAEVGDKRFTEGFQRDVGCSRELETDEWMDGWIEGWMDEGLMDRITEGWLEEWMDEFME